MSLYLYLQLTGLALLALFTFQNLEFKVKKYEELWIRQDPQRDRQERHTGLASFNTPFYRMWCVGVFTGICVWVAVRYEILPPEGIDRLCWITLAMGCTVLVLPEKWAVYVGIPMKYPEHLEYKIYFGQAMLGAAWSCMLMMLVPELVQIVKDYGPF